MRGLSRICVTPTVGAAARALPPGSAQRRGATAVANPRRHRDGPARKAYKKRAAARPPFAQRRKFLHPKGAAGLARPP